MDNSTKTFTLKAIHGEITIKRNEHGIPEISAKNREDLYYGLGHAHASDRLVQMLLVRAIARGEASEKFAGTDELIEIDKFMRWINFRKDNDHEMSKLKPDVKKELDAYCAGINSVIDEGKRPFEFKLTGYKPERWLPEDSLITVKVMGYIGLAQAQGDMEKFLIQLIQNDVPEEKIRAIFPYLKEEINFELIKEINLAKPIVPGDLFNTILPNIKASNNWVVSGKRTLSGHPLLASDPHMEVNRLPALWYEAVLNLPENYMMGITMPGVPVVVMGRTRDIAWGGTYGFMDMIDYFIEECKDEQYMIDGNWKPFTIRKETIHPKKKKPMTFTFYENQHGVLEGDPKVPGKYLAMAFTGRDNAGSEIFNLLMRTDEIKTVPEAQKKFRQLTMPTFNWVLADREGNIGYQMNGKMPKRPEGISGLLPIPGWNSTNDWQGYEDPALLPNELNPENGYFATANNDMNEFGTLKPINLPMADYRHKRILELLEENDKIDPEYVKKMQYDLYSRQAELLMPLFAPFIPDTENGKILKEWDYNYDLDSRGATLFESVYQNIVRLIFGENGFGSETVDYILAETTILTDFYGNFDAVLLDENSPWFKDKKREEFFREGIEKGLKREAVPYRGIRKYDMLNIFLNGQLPGFLGFDVRGMSLPGGRATIAQGQIFKNAGRISSFAPSFRMIAEMEKDGMETVIAGGPSGSRFSKWYKADLQNWMDGNYKKI